MLSLRIAPPIVVLTLASIFTIALAVVAVSSAHAQGPDMQIKQLDCESDPELLVIGNEGDQLQDFDGWKVESDPPGSESFDLSTLGSLSPGASVTIQSGPSATGIFTWSLDEIYRDNDSTDFARIVDDTGGVVHQVNCGVAATPTPAPTPTPTATPEVVPNGGGPPPPSASGLATLLTIAIGGFIAVLGVGIVAVPRLRLRLSSAEAASSPPAAKPARRASWGANLALVGYAATIAALLVLLRRRES
jgi:hypothetical protein